MALSWHQVEACARDVLSEDRMVRSGVRAGGLTLRDFRNRLGERLGWTPTQSKRELKGYKENFIQLLAEAQKNMLPSPLSSSASSKPRLRRLRRHKKGPRTHQSKKRLSVSDDENECEKSSTRRKNKNKRLRKKPKRQAVLCEVHYLDDEAEVDGFASEDEDLDDELSGNEDQLSQLVDDTSIPEEEGGFHAAVDAKRRRDSSLVALGRGAKRIRRGGVLRAAMAFANSPSAFERAYQRGELEASSQTPSSLPSSRYLDTDDDDDICENTPAASSQLRSDQEEPNSLVIDLTEDTPFLKRARGLTNDTPDQAKRIVLNLFSPQNEPRPPHLLPPPPPPPPQAPTANANPVVRTSRYFDHTPSANTLSEEQRLRIEENRRAALQRRQQRQQHGNQTDFSFRDYTHNSQRQKNI